MLAADGLRSPTRASLGTASLSISSLFVFSSAAKVESPVTLPPGRARLATRPYINPVADCHKGIHVYVTSILRACWNEDPS
jgi:hypothetical protein